MKWITKFLFLIAALVAFNGHADVVRFEQINPEADPKVVSQPYMLATPSAKIYVSSGTGRSIKLFFKDHKGALVATREKNNVDFNDTFEINGTKYFGAIFTVDNLPEGPLTLTVQRGTFDLVNDFTTVDYPVLVDLTPPTITGDFFWDGSTSYWRIHDDGKYVLTLASVKQGGFKSASVGLSGYSHATFSSQFLDGPKAGTYHAKDLPALLTDNGSIVIGTGAENSISSTYVPANTAAQMRFSFKLHSKAGHIAEKAIDVYVATRATQSKPTPYAVFTGASTTLDGIPAFTGFIPYTPGMTVNTNPVRMIYRANRDHYYGGGGDADLYGGWVNGTRNKNRIVHMDDEFIYFDITGSTNGKQINEGTYYIRDLASWRRYFFEHQLTLGEAITPPKATEIAFYQASNDRWFTHASSLTTYITKDNTNGQTESISKIRVTVQPRPYVQRFNYDFNPSGTRYQANCLIPAGETQCTIDANLPYPGNDVGTYHNRHRITAIGNSMVSDELVSNWMYDGSPATIVEDSILHDQESKTVTFTVKKDYVTRIWSNSQIRLVRLNAAPASNPTQRINLTQKSLTSQQIDGSQYNTYTFTYSSLPDGQYAFHAYVEDGFSSAVYRHKREHNILSTTTLDLTPPVINSNLTSDKPVTSLTSIRVNLTDSSTAFVRSMIITGGPDNINLALPYQLTSLKEYRAEYIFLNPTEDQPYTLTIIAADISGNESSRTFQFHYQPPLTRIPDTKLPSISSPLRNTKGVPSNVIVTPQIRNSEGAPARGVHQVYFTLTPTAEVALKVNGETVQPGETISFDTNLSTTNHRLRLEVYPETGGDVTENDFQIHIPNIKVTLCPVNFVESGTQCVFLNFKELTYNCPPDFTLNGSKCESTIVYEPTTTCADGYSLDGLTCKGSYKIPPVATCPTGYGLVDKNTCLRQTTVEAKTCPQGKTLEDGMCKDSDGNFTETSIYCSGHDVSSAPYCENDICTTYNPSWNACEVTTPASSSMECSSGTLTGGQCVVNHTYNLNVSCPFGYNREGLNCTRLEIIDPIKSCDAGWEMTSTGCIQQEFAPFTSCPATHALLDGRCHHLEDVIITCPATFTWNGTECSRIVYDEATPVCPTGYEWTGTTCRRQETIDATPICDATYTWDGTQCSRTVTQAADPICSTGYTWNSALSTCQKEEFMERIAICENGQTVSGETCLEDVTKPAVITCSAGFTWNGTACTQTQVSDATPNCQSGYTWNSATSRCEKTETTTATPICPSGYTWSTTNSRCEQPQTQAATPICPSGYAWSPTNSRCEKTNTQSATPVCPTGYTWSSANSRCEQPQTQAATPVCPSGYAWSPTNSRCEKTNTQSATPVCPTGYTWSSANSRCEQPQTQAATPICASGYTWNGSVCAKPETQTATPVCASGYSWNGSTCAKSETVTATPACPSGYSLSGTQCVKNETQSATPVCASGYTWNGSACAKTNTQSATPVCASGYTWNGSTCAKPETTTATRTCPSGYTWNGSTCAKPETTTATPVCASGYTWNGSTCAKAETTAATRSCPSGYTWNGSTCAKPETTAATRSCPSGYTWNGSTCAKAETQSATPICASGYSWNGSNCSLTQTQSPSLVCPPGTTQEIWGTCYQTVSSGHLILCDPGSSPAFMVGWGCYSGGAYWNVKTPMIMTCPSGQTALVSSSSSSPTYSCNTTPSKVRQCPAGWVLTGSTCTQTLTQSPTSYSCPSGWSLSGSKCNRTLTAAATYSCASGWTLSGTSCNRTLTATPTYSCASGWTLSGTNCNRTVTQAPSSYTCPSGWTVSGSQCNRTLTATPTYSCSSGWTLSGTNCNRTLTQAPSSYSCPSGWTVSGTNCNQTVTQAPSSYTCPSGWTVSGSSCNRTLTATPTYSCASGWTLGGTNCNRTLTQSPTSYTCPSGWTVSGSQCNRTLTQAPSSYSCPSGWSLSGSSCNRTLTSSPSSYTCPSGWTVNGANCNQLQTSAPSSYTCPSGWTLSGTSCNRTVTSGVSSYTCPSGWTLSGSTCSQLQTTSPSSYTCPSGWTVSGSSCTRVVNSAPSSYTCNTGWSLSGTNCSRLLTANPVSYSCASGWNLSGDDCSRTLTQAPTQITCESGWNVIGTMCSRTNILTPSNYECQSGWSIKGSQCARTLSQPPSSYTCPTNWNLNGVNCNQLQSRDPASYSCLTGWDLSSTSCNRYVYTEIDAYVCQNGWDLEGNQCSTDETAEEDRSCKPAYSLMNRDLCSKDIPDDFVGNCEQGWTPLATQCLFTHSKGFNLSCTEGFALNQQQCHRTLEQPVNVACQPGDIFVDGQCRNSISTPVITTCDSPFVKFESQCRHRIQINNFDQI